MCHLGGEKQQAGTFAQRVYQVVQAIPRGMVATYGQVAYLAGSPRAARAVGSVLHSCDLPGEAVPCHRVVNSKGALAPPPHFAREGGQRNLLEAEGVAVDEQGKVDLRRFGWRGEMQ